VRGAEGGLLQGELDQRLGVGTPSRRAAASGAEGVAAEEGVEEVAEPERVGACGGASVVVAEHVVAATALRVAQRLVRARDLLEPLLVGGIVVPAVGVIAACQLAVRALDVVFGGRTAHAEQLVEVGAHERWRPSCCETAVTAASACR
jgi:hypothetical protein